MQDVFPRLRRAGFDIAFTYHADAILHRHFPDAGEELDRVIGAISIPVVELVRGGGGEAQVTQRLRRALSERGWRKETFYVEKKINDRTTFAQSHEVDHVKQYPNGSVALELEWNNKDPFFDRDLENFNRLHADGGISIGIIVTRGVTFQNGIRELLQDFARSRGMGSFGDLEQFGISPTGRQRQEVERYIHRTQCGFAEAWSTCFARDKFSSATTHWAKLKARLDRGVGAPCPTVGIGIPLSRIDGLGEAARDRP